MNYSLNAGEWNSVFAVPSSVVDKYIKIASSGSLKLLLFLLRHGGKIFSDKELKDALGFRREGELEDAALFWVQRGIINAEKGSLAASAEEPIQETLPEMAAPAAENKPSRSVRKLSDNGAVIYTSGDIGNRIKTDPAIDYLFKQAEILYKAPLTVPQSRVVLMLVDHYGLPAEVSAMLLTYCFRIGKTSPGYIQSVAENWAEEDIRTAAAADERLAKLEKRFSIEEQLRAAMELKTKFSPKQISFIKVWSEDWGFSADMILLAHERTLDNIGNMNFKYTNTILENWHNNGINTRAAADEESSKRKAASGKAPAKSSDSRSSIDVSDVMQDVLQKYRSEG